jgi:biotin carboxyl carrier protein
VWFDRQRRGGSRDEWVKMAEDVRAEIVASVLEVVVSEGDDIAEGDTVVLLESMKMEIPVLAEVAGKVTAVNVAVGDVIQAGDLIAVIT